MRMGSWEEGDDELRELRGEGEVKKARILERA